MLISCSEIFRHVGEHCSNLVEFKFLKVHSAMEDYSGPKDERGLRELRKQITNCRQNCGIGMTSFDEPTRDALLFAGAECECIECGKTYSLCAHAASMDGYCSLSCARYY